MNQNQGKSNDFSQAKAATGADRRIFVRLHTKVNVHHRPMKFQTEPGKKNAELERFSVSKDLSAGGMVFAAQDQYPISTTLELKIEIPDSKTPIDCFGRVVRVTEIEPSTTYDIAVCFLDLSGTDRAKLEKFVQEEIP